MDKRGGLETSDDRYPAPTAAVGLGEGDEQGGTHCKSPIAIELDRCNWVKGWSQLS